MYSFLRFPNFRTKAVTLSYDDGVVFDKRLMQICDENGLKCTFNVNSGAYGAGRHLPLDEAVALYKNSGHEVAVHGVKHLSLAEVPQPAGVWDMLADRRAHEETYGCLVRGMAYGNGSYNDVAVETLKACGIVYGRTTKSTERFDIPTDWLRLEPTCHHGNPRLQELIDEFLEDKPTRFAHQVRPKLFYLWGHSYEFNDRDNWEVIENFARQVGNREDVWYATNIEVYDYVKAFDSLLFSVDCQRVKNPTATDLWICVHGKETFVPAGAEVEIK